MAKISKGCGFKGVLNYILDSQKETKVLDAEGVRLKNKDSVIQSFIAQAKLNPKLGKSVGHISLDFSAQDKSKVTDELMVKVAREYMQKMGIVNTQYIVARHHDKEHPHIHLCFNRVDNQCKTISDKNDRFRSEKICKELTEKYGLYFATGKENVKMHRLKEPDKTKYEIYQELNKLLPKCKDWKQLISSLDKMNTGVQFKYKGKTDEKQGIIFSKNGYSFNGSKVDRMFSYSKIDYQLHQNDKSQKETAFQQSIRQDNHTSGQSSILESAVSTLGGLFDIQPSPSYDENEAEALRLRKKKKKKGRSL